MSVNLNDYKPLDSFSDIEREWESFAGAQDGYLPGYDKSEGKFYFHQALIYPKDPEDSYITAVAKAGANVGARTYTAARRSCSPDSSYEATYKRVYMLIQASEQFFLNRSTLTVEERVHNFSRLIRHYDSAKDSLTALHRTYTKENTSAMGSQLPETRGTRGSQLEELIATVNRLKGEITNPLRDDIDGKQQAHTDAIRLLMRQIYQGPQNETSNERSYFSEHVKPELSRVFGQACMNRAWAKLKLENETVIDRDLCHTLVVDMVANLTWEDAQYIFEHRNDENSLPITLPEGIDALAGNQFAALTPYQQALFVSAIRSVNSETNAPLIKYSEKKDEFLAQASAQLDLFKTADDYILDARNKTLPLQKLAYSEYLLDVADLFTKNGVSEAVLFPMLDPRQHDDLVQTPETHLRLMRGTCVGKGAITVLPAGNTAPSLRVVLTRDGESDTASVLTAVKRDLEAVQSNAVPMDVISLGGKSKDALKVIEEFRDQPLANVNALNFIMYGATPLSKAENDQIGYIALTQPQTQFTFRHIYTDKYPKPVEGSVIPGCDLRAENLRPQVIVLTSRVDQTKLDTLKDHLKGESFENPNLTVQLAKETTGQAVFHIGHVLSKYDDRVSGTKVTNQTEIVSRTPETFAE